MRHDQRHDEEHAELLKHVEAVHSYHHEPEEEQSHPCGCCCRCCVLLVILALLVAAQALVAYQVAPAFVAKSWTWRRDLRGCELAALRSDDDPAPDEPRLCGPGEGYLRTPANASVAMDFPNCRGGYQSPLVEEMVQFNTDNPWKLVSLVSRPGDKGQKQVNLTAWWLPAKNSSAPRVVVVHGGDANFNHWTVQTLSYLLRSLGFAVLLPSLRDHGSSGMSPSDGAAWGWDYYLDVLGAWDYAASDPEGKLGGGVGDGQVGLVGIGLGGFAALMALGLEPRIPAAWVDSAVFDLRRLLQSRITAELEGLVKDTRAEPAAWLSPYLAPLFSWATWRYAEFAAGADLDHMSPAKALKSPVLKTRSVAIVHSKHDDKVPKSESDLLVDFLDSNDKYEAEELYFVPSFCGRETHAVTHFWRPDVYRDKLCIFWSDVFGTGHSQCNQDDLPDLESVSLGVTATSTEAPTTTTTLPTTSLTHPKVAMDSPLWRRLHSTSTTRTTSTTQAHHKATTSAIDDAAKHSHHQNAATHHQNAAKDQHHQDAAKDS